MKLTIKDRIQLLGILPKEGNIDTIKALRKFKESLSLSEEEKTAIVWRLEYHCPKCNVLEFLSAPVQCGNCNVWMDATGAGQWDSTKDPNKDVFIQPTIMTIVVSTLSKMNEKGKLTDELESLYDKFCGSKDSSIEEPAKKE
jgi:hypothetical protein